MTSGTMGFEPTASWQVLKFRAQLMARLRRFFDNRGFLEVETPLLSADTVVDRYLEPLSVISELTPACGSTPSAYWLQTSPEFCMKRLMAAGAPAIYQITRAFRDGERGRLHNLEFTILEWYRAGDTMQAGMDLLDDLIVDLLACESCERISYRDAFLRHAQLDPHLASCSEIMTVAQTCRIAKESLARFDRDDLLQTILAELVESHLGVKRPTILYDYPASQAALARVRDSDPTVAERFELYVNAMELANGYCELLDAQTMLLRARQANELRERDGKRRLPESSRLLQAMEHGLPSCTGVALGFDRLVMAAAGAESIEQVMAFPFDIA